MSSSHNELPSAAISSVPTLLNSRLTYSKRAPSVQYQLYQRMRLISQLSETNSRATDLARVCQAQSLQDNAVFRSDRADLQAFFDYARLSEVLHAFKSALSSPLDINAVPPLGGGEHIGFQLHNVWWQGYWGIDTWRAGGKSFRTLDIRLPADFFLFLPHNTYPLAPGERAHSAHQRSHKPDRLWSRLDSNSLMASKLVDFRHTARAALGNPLKFGEFLWYNEEGPLLPSESQTVSVRHRRFTPGPIVSAIDYRLKDFATGNVVNINVHEGFPMHELDDDLWQLPGPPAPTPVALAAAVPAAASIVTGSRKARSERRSREKSAATSCWTPANPRVGASSAVAESATAPAPNVDGRRVSKGHSSE